MDDDGVISLQRLDDVLLGAVEAVDVEDVLLGHIDTGGVHGRAAVAEVLHAAVLQKVGDVDRQAPQAGDLVEILLDAAVRAVERPYDHVGQHLKGVESDGLEFLVEVIDELLGLHRTELEVYVVLGIVFLQKAPHIVEASEAVDLILVHGIVDVGRRSMDIEVAPLLKAEKDDIGVEQRVPGAVEA